MTILAKNYQSIRRIRRYLFSLLLIYLLVEANKHQDGPLNTFAQAQQLVAATAAEPIKPALILILPQSFKVPTNPFRNENNAKASQLQQYVAIINNAQNDLEDQQIRQNYKKLSLQIRDAWAPQTGQLFFETVFDYFPSNTRNHLLIPVNLEQVSPVRQDPHLANKQNGAKPTYSNKLSSRYNPDKSQLFERQPAGGYQSQQLIVSIRPVVELTGLGSETEELVSSAPILIESVPSGDGQRTFSIVQTDKPIYKPSERVKIRVLVVNENLRPILGDDVRIQMRNPQKILVEEIRFPRPSYEVEGRTNQNNNNNKQPLYLDHEFEFPPEPMLGAWTVQLLHSDPVANDTISFEVKEYVLPPFEVTFEAPRYVLPNTTTIQGAVVAKYHYGKPVQGKVELKFGWLESPAGPKFVARTSHKTIDPSSGRVEYKISTDRFRDRVWFPQIAGTRMIVEATVTEITTGHTEIVQDTSCSFVKQPFRISFDESIDDFKPGLSQELKVQLVETLSSRRGPAGVRIVAEYRDQNNVRIDAPSVASENRPVDFRNRLDTEATTNERGEAVFTIGPLKDDITTIYVSMHALNPSDIMAPAHNDGAKLSKRAAAKNDLASGQFALMKHESQNGWISLMNKSQTHMSVGDTFVSDILIRDAVVIPHKIFYVITNKGHLVSMNNLDSNGLINFKVSEEMMPSVRLVLFALTHDSIGLLSDSMRLTIDQDLTCALKIEYKSSNKTPQISTDIARPNESGRLDVSARPGDVVSLIGVDNAIYSLNNRTRLESSRIVERVKRLDPGCGFGGGRNNLDVFHNAGLMLFKDAASVGPQGASIGSACFSFAHHLKYVEDAMMGFSKPMMAHYGRSKLDSSARPDLRPSLHHRKKREIDPETVIASYSDPVHKSCCRLGTLEDFPQKRRCDVRKRIVDKYIRDSGKCAAIYYECCRQIFDDDHELKVGGFTSPRGETEISARSERPLGNHPMMAPPTVGQLDQLEAQTLIRRDFRETWLFDIVDVDATTGRGSLEVRLPHSITAWSISALALNPDKPMCLMQRPLIIRGFQEVFIHLSMPYKVVQGEQIDLVATLFNYSPTSQDLLVYMYGIEDVCSEAEPGERSEPRRFSLDKHSSQALIFTMIPLRVGSYPIKIVAVTTNSNTSDIVERQLRVVPRGRPITEETTFSLDPMNQQRRSKRAIQTGNLVDEIDSQRGLQRSRVRLTPLREAEHIVPQTQECIVSAIGDKLGQTVQTTILDVENLIRLPHGCGEQVMIYLGPTLYTARYLNSIGKLTGDTRWRANRYIQSGYKRVLNFRNDNGAFSAFPGRNPSVWLTAFVAKMLCQVERTPFVADEVHVDKTVIRSALSWLVDKQHEKSGTWIEWNPVYHREMLGGVLKEKGLTAFVAITFNECSHHSPDIVDEIQIDKRDRVPVRDHDSHAEEETNGFAKLKLATQKAEEALVMDRWRALKERKPYILALVAYSLSLSRPREAANILSDLFTLAERSTAKNQLFWRGDHQIETAAYALQALIELAPLVSSPELSQSATNEDGSPRKPNWMPGTDAVAIANWLSTRRSYTGAFESTQDTVVALEALSKFAQLQPTPSGNGLVPQSPDAMPSLYCNVTINNRTRRSIEFVKDNAQVLQTFKLDPLDTDPMSGETLDIVTSGNGLGTMTVKLKYNIFQDEDELCRFSIDSTIEEWRPKISVPSEKPTLNDPVRPTNDVGDNQLNATGAEEDDFFKTFDKSMLNELNLIDINQNYPPLAATQPSAPKVSRDKQRQVQYLRLRRFAPLPVASTRDSSDHSEDGWTSKMFSSIRSKLPSWIAPKTSTTTTTTTRPPVVETTRHDPMGDQHSAVPEAARRNNTFRRSAQTNVPLISSSHAGIPVDAHLNTLSKQLELPKQNRSSTSNTTTTTTQQNIVENPTRRLVLLLRVCTHYMSSAHDSEMAVIEVGVLSGFKPNEADLKEIQNEPDTPVSKYELSSDGTMIMIYLQHVPSSGPFCFQFRLIRDSLVYNLQSGFIRVYEYYNPKHSCSNFYTPSRITNLMETKCDASGEVCQCAARSLCPASSKLIGLSSAHETNSTNARNQLVDLVCKNKYDLVSLVKLKSIRVHESARTLKLSVKVTADLRGNLTKIVEAQRQQKTQLANQVRKPHHSLVNIVANSLASQADGQDNSSAIVEEETSLDQLQLTIDPGCLKDDPLLLHLAHTAKQKNGGEQMILFARSDRIERRYFRVTQKINGLNGGQRPRAPTLTFPTHSGPKPKANILGLSGESHANMDAELGLVPFEDAQQLQYSLALPLDRDTIFHDVSYQAKVSHREAINSLILWLEIRSRRERWTCPTD